MAKSRVTATNRLANVIEVVELGRRTGLLSAERDANGLEEGEIYFISGHPVYALLGRLTGREALNILLRWGECRFAFEPSAPRPIPNVSGVLPALDSNGDPYGVTTDYDGRPPTEGPRRQSAPNSGAGAGWGYRGSSPNMAPGMPPGFNPSAPNMPNTPNLGNSGVWNVSDPSSFPSGPGGRPAPGQQYPPEQQMPRRTPDVRDLKTIVATYGLSRGHRTILLLANGQHTVLDMARLASKSLDEVYQLLNDLRNFGLIY